MVSSGAEQPLLTRGSVPSSRARTLCLCLPILSCGNKLIVPARKRRSLCLGKKRERGKGQQGSSGRFLFLQRLKQGEDATKRLNFV